MKSFKLLLLSFAFAVVGLFSASGSALAAPEECESYDLRVNSDGSTSEITYNGNTVSGTCVLTANRGEDNLFHTGILSEDGVFNGAGECTYTITGLGTTSVSVVSNSRECTLVHLDMFFGEQEPEPEEELNMSLQLIGPSCGGNGFDIKATITDNGNPVANHNLVFTYKGLVVPAATGADGVGQASFSFQGNDGVNVDADGLASQGTWVASPNGCPGGGGGGGTSVLGASTGEVLGASTLADAGLAQYRTMIALYMLGSGLVLTGLVKNAFSKAK